MPVLSEEDVLAIAVLCVLINEHDSEDGRDHALEASVMVFRDDPPALADRIRLPGALEIARSRRRDGRTWAEVVADSERRTDVERARDDVLREARRLPRDLFSPLGDAVRALVAVESRAR